MPTLTLKDLPRDLHRDLKKRAKAHHRSLNKEVIATLRAATAPVLSLDLAAFDENVRRARALFKRPVAARQVTSWKREGRL